MKANIPKEQELAIFDYIYLNLMVEILEGKLSKGMDVDSSISEILKQSYKVKKYMKINGIKVQAAVPDHDGLFVSYPYSVNVMGGYKQGEMRFWRSALVYQLREKMKLLQQGKKFIESEF